MVGCSRGSLPTWMTAAAARVDLSGGVTPSHQGPSSSSPSSGPSPAAGADQELGMYERAFSAAGAAFVSAIIVNPLDVAKTRLQAQAAGVLYNQPAQMAALGPDAHFQILSEFRCSPSCTRGLVLGSEPVCPPDCFQYKGTLDVFLKVVRQEGFVRLWRGTNAGLALAVPTVGIYLPCYDIFRNWIEDFTRSNAPGLTPYAPLVAGSVARSLACIACSPIELARTRMQMRRKLLGFVGEEGNAGSVLGVNFAAGFVAGSLAAGATCPLDVAKTRRQIEKDTEKAMRMTTRQTLAEIWSPVCEPQAEYVSNSISLVQEDIKWHRSAQLVALHKPQGLWTHSQPHFTNSKACDHQGRSGGMKGLFAGVGPRVARAGPSVGIVISFYEVVKYALHQRHTS
ncbi:Mitochondrial carrier protein MTM1 [Zea mays]|uniref:Mitochondrial carrier protein MTM1 n=1 Tax=Zea mays TaxID=4577 RepID=A0A3L6F336_MAIZE|nr:Mitochondrial carrier protein MTM1 [Zea mays]